MTDRTILQRNKAVLWARDIISRANVCLVVTGDTTGGATGIVTVSSVDGRENMDCELNDDPHRVNEFVKALAGKEIVVTGLTDSLIQSLREQSVELHDLLEYYRIYLNTPDIRVAPINSSELNTWVRELLQKMAGSSLVLDQANTGDGKWTSSHFKPGASMMDKIKSMLKS